ncbi:MAG: glycosyltransferase [Planctomycetes bacterium]|nr:glycosyltransferase [Planctomycetota bacterium]MCB9886803.1 glycosyltransferase [Planctomycetota bacterium]
MRILFLTPFLPAPDAHHGGGIYLSALAAALARQAEIGLCALLHPEEELSLQHHPAPWSWHGSAPLPQRPLRAGRRRHQLRMLWRWRRMPLGAAKHWQPELVPLLQRALREFRPDVVCVEMAQMAQYLPFLRQVPTVLTDHEAGCPANTTTGLGRWGDARDRRLWRRFVHRFYPLATHVQAVTSEDAAALSALLHRPVGSRGPAFAVPDRPVAPGAAPPRALFLGDYRHGPNPEAARVLARQVLPRLRARHAQAELWLAGPNQDPALADLRDVPGLRLVGFAPDLAALFAQVRVMLAPLFSGGGFRVKSLAALAHGLPVVTNALGARGCTAAPPARVVVEGADALAAAALELLESPQAARAAGEAAYAWARANLADQAVANQQLQMLRTLLAAPTR